MSIGGGGILGILLIVLVVVIVGVVIAVVLLRRNKGRATPIPPTGQAYGQQPQAYGQQQGIPGQPGPHQGPGESGPVQWTQSPHP